MTKMPHRGRSIRPLITLSRRRLRQEVELGWQWSDFWHGQVRELRERYDLTRKMVLSALASESIVNEYLAKMSQVETLSEEDEKIIAGLRRRKEEPVETPKTDLQPLRILAQRFTRLSMYDHSAGHELTTEERRAISQQIYDLIEKVEGVDEIDRNARAYGFEVGRGHPLTKKITELSPDNPFRVPEWKDEIVPDASTVPPWYAPFTDEQVAELHRWQITPWVHPFTCGNFSLHEGYHVNLVPHREGWFCPDDRCDFVQVWCYSFMADGSLPTESPMDAARGLVATSLSITQQPGEAYEDFAYREANGIPNSEA